MELYLKARRAYFQQGLSKRAIARTFGISRDSVDKMIVYSVPPGYRRVTPVKRPKLDGFTDIIDRWLQEDIGRPRKQHHAAKRVFERLRDKHGFSDGYTIVKTYIREHQWCSLEMLVLLHHALAHGQVDFGESLVEIGGVEQKTHFFAFNLPHCDDSAAQRYVRRLLLGRVRRLFFRVKQWGLKNSCTTLGGGR